MDRRLYEEKLKKYIQDKKIKADQLLLEESSHTVDQAAKALSTTSDMIGKSICMMSDGLLVGIVLGPDRLSSKRLAKALNIERPSMVPMEDLENLTGYPCGGVPGFGFEARFIVDERIMEKDYIYLGGGSDRSMVKISPEELLRANGGQVYRIRK